MCHLFRCLGAHEVLTCSSCRPVFAVVPYFTPVFPQTPMLSPFPPTIGVWGEPGDHPRVSPSVYHTYTVSTLSRTPCLVASCILSPPLPPQGRECPAAVLPDRSLPQTLNPFLLSSFIIGRFSLLRHRRAAELSVHHAGYFLPLLLQTPPLHILDTWPAAALRDSQL